jgi:hypothetical protein
VLAALFEDVLDSALTAVFVVDAFLAAVLPALALARGLVVELVAARRAVLGAGCLVALGMETSLSRIRMVRGIRISIG